METKIKSTERKRAPFPINPQVAFNGEVWSLNVCMKEQHVKIQAIARNKSMVRLFYSIKSC